jgi:transcription elongation factor Elf1
MRIKDIGDIIFYSTCACKNITHVVCVSFEQLTSGGGVVCERCGASYVYDDNQEVEYAQWFN